MESYFSKNDVGDERERRGADHIMESWTSFTKWLGNNNKETARMIR